MISRLPSSGVCRWAGITAAAEYIRSRASAVAR